MKDSVAVRDDLDDFSAHDDDDEDQVTSQATQGYSEALADQSELDFSEVESSGVFHQQPPPMKPVSAGAGAGAASFVSPLEYSAMLKLYSSNGGGPVAKKSSPSSSGAHHPDPTDHPPMRSKPGDVWQKKQPSAAAQPLSKDLAYSRLSTSEVTAAGNVSPPGGHPSTVFSTSSSSSDEEEAGQVKVSKDAEVSHMREYRWDGKPLNEEKSGKKQPAAAAVKTTTAADDAKNDMAAAVAAAAAADETESCFTEDQDDLDADDYDDDESALADIETDYDEDAAVTAATAATGKGGSEQLMARAHTEKLQQSMVVKHMAARQQSSSGQSKNSSSAQSSDPTAAQQEIDCTTCYQSKYLCVLPPPP